MPTRTAYARQKARRESLVATDPEVLDEYAQHEWSHVRQAAAANPHTKPATLRYLAGDRWPPVRDAVAANPAAGADALTFLARSKLTEEWCLVAVARHPNRTPETLGLLATRRYERVRALAVHDPACPADVIVRATRSKSIRVAAAALSNPALPDAAHRLRTASEPVLRAMLDDWLYVPGVGLHPLSLSDPALDLLHAWATGPDDLPFTLALALARHRDLRPDTLYALAVRAPGTDLLSVIADHPACPDEARVLAALAGVRHRSR